MVEYAPIPDEANRVAKAIVQAAVRVHKALGPGLLESVYCACLAQELVQAGFSIRCEVPLPVEYNGLKLEIGYRIDMLSTRSWLWNSKLPKPFTRSMRRSY